MSLSPHTVLVTVVDHYEESDAPVTARAVAESQAAPAAELSRSLDSLCEFELLESTEDGYRPTVTARELLALDIELDDALVVDVVEE